MYRPTVAEVTDVVYFRRGLFRPSYYGVACVSHTGKSFQVDTNKEVSIGDNLFFFGDCFRNFRNDRDGAFAYMERRKKEEHDLVKYIG